MKTHEVYQRPYVKLYIDEDIPAIYEDWIGAVTGEEFIETMEAKLSAYQQYKQQIPSLEWIMDLRQLQGLKQGDIERVAQDFYPRLFPAGIRKFAFVVPSSTYLELSDDQVGGKMDSKGQLMLGYFNTYQHAAQWLAETHVSIT